MNVKGKACIMKELLIDMAKGLVEDPDAVTVTEDAPTEDGTVVFHLRVAPSVGQARARAVCRPRVFIPGAAVPCLSRVFAISLGRFS